MVFLLWQPTLTKTSILGVVKFSIGIQWKTTLSRLDLSLESFLKEEIPVEISMMEVGVS